MKLLRGLLIAIVVLVGVAIAAGFALPRQARLERSISLSRPPATVFAVLDGFRHFGAWSPWSQLDSDMQVGIEGPMSGVGARYRWTSDKPGVGSGSQEILESVPYSRIRVALVFSGMDATNRASYLLRPEGAGTRLTWTYETDFGLDLIGRVFGLMLDRTLGRDFELGLRRLAQHLETLPPTDFSDLDVQVLEVPAQRIAYVSRQSSTDAATIARAYRNAFDQISAALARDGIKVDDASLIAIGRRWDADSGRYEFDAAIPVPAGTQSVQADREVKLGSTYGGLVLKTSRRGAAQNAGAHLQKLMAYKLAHGYVDNGTPWDVYVSEGGHAADGERVTETYVPVQ